MFISFRVPCAVFSMFFNLTGFTIGPRIFFRLTLFYIKHLMIHFKSPPIVNWTQKPLVYLFNLLHRSTQSHIVRNSFCPFTSIYSDLRFLKTISTLTFSVILITTDFGIFTNCAFFFLSYQNEITRFTHFDQQSVMRDWIQGLYILGKKSVTERSTQYELYGLLIIRRDWILHIHVFSTLFTVSKKLNQLRWTVKENVVHTCDWILFILGEK